ncbi:MAG TPA: hypothetical protein VGG37_04415, partial [Opitutaceae bacterium]
KPIFTWRPANLLGAKALGKAKRPPQLGSDVSQNTNSMIAPRMITGAIIAWSSPGRTRAYRCDRWNVRLDLAKEGLNLPVPDKECKQALA